MSVFSNISKEKTDINDEVIVSSIIASSSGMANAYLNATITSTTPEFRALCGTNLSQVIEGQSAFTALAVKKEWVNPYSPSVQQLADTYQKSMATVKS